MNANEARTIRDATLSEYKELARRVYLPIAEESVVEAAKKGASSTDVRLGGGWMREVPVPEIRVVDEVIRILKSDGFDAKYKYQRDSIVERQESIHGRHITIEW